MGYTHYFRVEKAFTEEQWNSFRTKVAEIFLQYKNILANGHGEENTKPIISKDEVIFNGIRRDSHETFLISKNGFGFNFCKTAYKPYDKVVVEF